MSLSDRERRILAEIEQDLRWQDRDFACRIDALNAKPARRRCPVNRREVAFVVIIVIAMSLLSAVVFIAAGRPRTTPPPTVGPTRDLVTTSPQVTHH
ncbi:MAG: DUF3040 domain-containing protein [Nonomuraea sp.]|nr:DUF3040 domain-containing protein [Nonomuraea sp.]NUP76059.1 DUF3040 domain-containing protein [Nonomuraea sp.]NUS02281.1 DUF3040 domain-containing protein [Nonomuraea sp.]